MATKKQTKAQRRAEAQARAEALRRAQQAKARRNRLLLIVGGVAVLAIIAIVVVLLVQQSAKSPLETTTKPAAADAHGAFAIDSKGVIEPDDAGATTLTGVAIDVYYDYMCHACVAFEATYKSQLDSLVDSGQATLVLHPMNFLDGGEQGSSTRALNSIAEVADRDPEHLRAYHEALLDHQWQAMGQSANGSVTSFAETDLTTLAQQAGVSQEAIDAFASHTYFDWADATTTNAKTRDLKVTSTPSIFLRTAATPLADAQRWQPGYVDTADLATAVADVAAGKAPPPKVTTPATSVPIPETTPTVSTD